MDSRLIIADDAVDLADSVNHIIIFLVLLNKFEQAARTLLNRLVVVRDEIDHVALGRVIYDAGYLISLLIAVALRPALDRIIGAGMIIGFVFRRNHASVAPFFIPAFISIEK